MKLSNPQKLSAKFPNIELDFQKQPGIIHLKPEYLVQVCESLKKDFGFVHLANLTAVDYKTHLEVIYNLTNHKQKVAITLKAHLPVEKPSIDSVSAVWPTADWQEREVYDFFGIKFNNHPDFRRLFLAEDFPGHPLRKKFKLEYDEEYLLEK